MSLKVLFGAGAVLALTAALAAAQPKADTPSNPFAKDPTAVDTGRTIFNATCIACHGNGGVGDRAPALNTGNFTHGGEDYQLFQTIHSGIPGTQMPSFANLPADDVWRVVLYIKSLSVQSGGAAPATPRPGRPCSFPTRADARAATRSMGEARTLPRSCRRREPSRRA